MKILIYGAGRIGSALGGFLSKKHEVAFLGRGRHLRQVKKKGLRVTGIWGKHTFRKIKLVADQSTLEREKPSYDLILVTVKSFDTLKAARSIKKFLAPHTRVLPFQNGLGNVETLRKVLPPGQVLAGRVIFGVVMQKPGCIRVTVIANPTAIGEARPMKPTARVKAIVRSFREVGLPSVASANVASLLWSKVIYNCALNPLASLLNCHYGFLGEDAWMRAYMEGVIEEIYRVARRARVSLEPSEANQYKELFYQKLLPATYEHYPSMLQDLKTGKPTEIESLCGAIVKLGKKKRMKTPYNRVLRKLIRERESRS